jgi:3-oxoacyl-[acyl-carrier-protein] synthase II
MGNALSGHISIRHGLRGANYVTVSACASSSHALGLAFHAVRDGLGDIMVTGGAEATITELAMAGFSNMKAMSKRNDEPERASRPFDRDRDGFVMGDGAGMLVFEELEHAKARGAEILAEVKGFGMTADAHHITAPTPEGEGPAQAMRQALADGQVDRERVTYINAHGTSTPLNDAAETRAIRTVFGEHADRLCVSSSKSMVGHLLGGSGGLETVLTARMIHDGVINPTINYETPDPDCDLDYVPNESRETPIDHALSNSLGFGGHNVSVLFARLDG